MPTIRDLWRDARQLMVERKLSRTLDRSIRRLQRIENYAVRSNAIFATDQEYLMRGIEDLRRCRALITFPDERQPHPAIWLYRMLRTKPPAPEC